MQDNSTQTREIEEGGEGRADHRVPAEWGSGPRALSSERTAGS